MTSGNYNKGTAQGTRCGRHAMGFNIKKVGANLWFLNVRVRRDGKEYRKRETFAGTKSAADDRFHHLRKELREGIKFDAPRKLAVFRDLLALYRERRLAIGEVDGSRYRALENDLGDVPLNVFAERFRDYLHLRRTNPSRATGKPLANGTLNRYVALATTAFNHAVNMELLDKNPLTKARFPKLQETARDKVLTDEECSRLVSTLKEHQPHLLPIFMFALQVPCRKSELVNMRREDLDLGPTPSIRLRNGTTKNKQGCNKPIPPNMLPYFQSIPAESEFVFYRKEKDGYHGLGCFSKAWYKALKLASIKGFRFHDTRHIAATTLLNNGTPGQAVQQIAGWKTDMLKTYYHRDGQQALNLIKFGDTRGMDT